MSEEATTRTPRVIGDEDLNVKIRETLLRPDVAGNIAVCAKMLGIGYGRVEKRIASDPYLSALCPTKAAEPMVPGETDIADRDLALGDGLLPTEQVKFLKSMLKKNDRVVKKGWRDIGLSDDEARVMEDAEQRSSLPIGRVLGASEGHMIALMAKSALLLEKLGDQLLKGKDSEHGPLPHITDMAGSDKTQLEFLKAYQSGVMTHIQLQGVLLKSRASMLDAMKKLKEMQADRAQPKRGTFNVELKADAATTDE